MVDPHDPSVFIEPIWNNFFRCSLPSLLNFVDITNVGGLERIYMWDSSPHNTFPYFESKYQKPKFFNWSLRACFREEQFFVHFHRKKSNLTSHKHIYSLITNVFWSLMPYWVWAVLGFFFAVHNFDVKAEMHRTHSVSSFMLVTEQYLFNTKTKRLVCGQLKSQHKIKK